MVQEALRKIRQAGEMYTLWLCPVREDEARLREVIERLAGENGTERFDPHVTLLSELASRKDALDAAWRAAGVSGGERIELATAGVTTSNERFRCVVIELEPRDRLDMLRRATAEIGVSEQSAYQPHVSVIYGQLPLSTRERMAEKVAKQLPESFAFDCIEIVETSVPVSDWRSIARISLVRTE